MKLYQLTFEGKAYYIEALSVSDAIEIWRATVMRDERYTRRTNGAPFSGTEDPDSCTRLSLGPVLRAEAA